MLLPSFAKVNWMLRIGGRRPDGFHELFTVFQTISLHDRITIDAASDISLTCDDPNVPNDETNLIVRAALALRQRAHIDLGARIHLEKSIPAPGGLGGGSSNAAVTLIGLCGMWSLTPSDSELQEIAAGLGFDVPFFLHGGTAIGRGRGEIIEPIPDINTESMIVVTPDVDVSTRDAFAGLRAVPLTSEGQKHILSVSRNEADSLDPLHSELKNDFERTIFAAYPEIERVKALLLELGARNAAMSGSGASVFAIFDKTETRQAAMKALDDQSTWRKFAVSTVSRSEYRDALSV